MTNSIINAVPSSTAQKANRKRNGENLCASVTPHDTLTMPPIASGRPVPQFTCPACAYVASAISVPGTTSASAIPWARVCDMPKKVTSAGTTTSPPRGINGPIDDVLFPIQHGILHYPGFDVLPPFVTHRAGRMDDTRFAQITRALGDRLDTLFTIDPIPFRQENAGDYEIPALTLRAEIAPDKSGFAAHIA